MKRAIELLAPAKDYLSVVAAVDAGADAVYMGASHFGARQAACNELEQIGRAVDFAHRYGVRIYLTLNTLIYEEELDRAETLARELIALGVDALIVQDMAFRRMELPVELHASTQVSNRTKEGVRFLEECGFARAILERGLSIEEIRAIRRATNIELECFVHGAICVGYSGRCFLSRSMHPDRSGNRGGCSQPCRLSYDLLTAKGERLLTGRHLLSLQDLNLSNRLGELMDAGVSSFKIEGRLKDTTYIRNVVAWYRQAIDRELALRPGLKRASVGRTSLDFTPDPAKSFTRGFTEYMYGGRQSGVASFATPKAVGEYVGEVLRSDGRSLLLDREAPLFPGDGLCFGREGFLVNRVEGRSIFPNRCVEIAPRTPLYRNYDRLFTQQVERSRLSRTIAVKAELEISEELLTLRYRDEEGIEVTCSRPGPFPEAEKPESMARLVDEQVRKSGDTIFRVEEFEFRGTLRFLKAGMLSELRREAFEALLQARLAFQREHLILPDNRTARYPHCRLEAEDNVTNSLAEAFYREHGVEEIARGLDLASELKGKTLLRSPYCIRREIGACLKEGTTLREELFLEHGRHRYRLCFDCAACEMSLKEEK